MALFGDGHFRREGQRVENRNQANQTNLRDIVGGNDVHAPRHPPCPADRRGVSSILQRETAIDLVAKIDDKKHQPHQKRDRGDHHDQHRTSPRRAASVSAGRRRLCCVYHEFGSWGSGVFINRPVVLSPASATICLLRWGRISGRFRKTKSRFSILGWQRRLCRGRDTSRSSPA